MAGIQEPSLESLLSTVPSTKLNKPCKNEHLCEIARSITDWQSIAPHLKLIEADQEEIVHDHHKITAQKIAMLRKWRQKCGSHATYQELARTFWKLDRIDLVEALCSVAKGDVPHGSLPRSSRSPIKNLLQHFKKTKSPRRDHNETMDTQLQPYTEHVRSVYHTEKPAFVKQWPPLENYQYINIAMIKLHKRQFGKDYEHRNLLMHGKVNDIMGRRIPVRIEDVFELDREKRKVILFEGAPGAGKSVLAWKICHKWEAGELFTELDLLLLILLRDPEVQMARTLADILPCRDKSIAHGMAEKIMELNGKGTVFVLDGWDELPPDLQQKSLFRDLIEQPHSISLPESSVIITSRPISSDDLHPLVSSRIEIVGFTPDRAEEFFTESLAGDLEALQRLKDQLSESPAVESACYLPLNAAIVVYLFLALGQSLPQTLHEVLKSLVEHFILRQLHRETGTRQRNSVSLNRLPEAVNQPFKHLCTLAHYGIMNNLIIFSEEIICTLGIPSPLELLGLMQAIPSLVQAGESLTYNFLHLSLQELLAAYHITQMPADEQVKTFKDLFDQPRFAATFQFYAGFTRLRTEGIQSVVTSIIQSEMQDSKSKHLLLLLLHCLYEAQDAEICRFVANQVKGLGEMDFKNTQLSSADYLRLGYFLACLYTNQSEVFKFPMDLSEQIKSEKCVRLVMKGLSASPELQYEPYGCVVLDLSKNCTVGSFYWATSLTTNLSVVELNLSSCSLQITDDNGPSITDMLRRNRTLKSLNLSSNSELGEAALQHIMEGVQDNTTLVQLNISSCSLVVTDHNAQALHKMLQKNTTLKSLNLSGNRNIKDTGVECISSGISENTSLIVLNLRNCGITGLGAKHLAEMLAHNKSLQSLDIGVNYHIGDGGIVSIAKALESNKTLKELLMPHCGITAGNLTDENLTDENLTDENQIQCLARTLETNNTLVKLDLSANLCITDAALIKLGEGLRNNRGLEILKLWSNHPPQVTNESLKQFILSLQESSLTKIYFWTWGQQKPAEHELQVVNDARKELGRPELKFLNK